MHGSSRRPALNSTVLIVALVIATGCTTAVTTSSREPASPTAAPTNAPTSAPTSGPTSAPSVAAAPPALDAATYVACDTTDPGKSCLPPGLYRLSGGPDVWPVTVTMDVPAGWLGWEANPGFDGVLRTGDASTHYAGTGWGVMYATVGDVFRDPCDATKGTIRGSSVGTPQALAAVMAGWSRFTTSTPKPITVDGHDGLEIQLTSTAPSACSVTGTLWRTTQDGTVDVYPMVGSTSASAPGTFEIVDTGRGLLVIRATDFPQTSPAEIAGGAAPDPTRHAADQVALQSILASIRLMAPGARS